MGRERLEVGSLGRRLGGEEKRENYWGLFMGRREVRGCRG